MTLPNNCFIVFRINKMLYTPVNLFTQVALDNQYSLVSMFIHLIHLNKFSLQLTMVFDG